MQGAKERITSYYTLADKAYRGWSEIPDNQEEPYSFHCGYHPVGKELGQYDSINLMTKKIIEAAKIENGQIILDAGCGVGSIAYKIAQCFPDSLVLGINIVPLQIQVANQFRQIRKMENLFYLLNSFDEVAFARESIDRVIFCESIDHSLSQKKTLQETLRILRPKGRMVLTGAFLDNRNLTLPEKEWARDYQKGWFISEMRTVDEFQKLAIKLGFSKPEIADLTINVLPSAKRLGKHAALRLNQQPNAPILITQSRKACVGLMELTKAGKLKYILATFQKD